jgi:integrase
MLTETDIKKLKAPEKRTSIRVGDNLYLNLHPSGSKTFIYRTKEGGDYRIITLGKFPQISLAVARAKASALTIKIDIPGAMTFGQLLDRWYEQDVEPRYSHNGANGARVYVKYGKRKAGNIQLMQLSQQRLVALLDAYAATSPVAANRCLTNWKLALDYGCQKGLLEHNPLARVTKSKIGGPEKARARVLTDDEIRKVMTISLPFYRFLLLTGLRISEALDGHQDGNRWIVPADISKNKKAHWCHLPDLALEQIDEPFPWQRMNEYQEWLREFCATEIEGEPFKPHDLRRTFRTRLSALGVLPHVAEKMINHSLKGVLAVYDRHDYADDRIAAAEQLAAEIKRITEA